MTKVSALNPLLSWLNSMLEFYIKDEITTPTDYRERVIQVKQLLDRDTSGLVNTVLDFYISASLVDYTVETTNQNLTDLLNDWLATANSSWRGTLPTGINDLAREYFRERWKGSGVCVLRTLWESKDGMNLPTRLWFVDGEDIKITSGQSDGEEIVRLDKIVYKLLISKDKEITLPKLKDEKIFVQKPFASWSNLTPTPFLMQRGIFKNLKFLELLESKGEKLVAKALEYLMMFKKGSERLFLEGNVSYGLTDLEKAKEDFRKFVIEKDYSKGTTGYFTNFDTGIEEYIPDYNKILNQQLYEPIERRLLFSLGLIDIVQGAGSTRRESTLNPKPLQAEINNGIKDFKKLLFDIMQEIAERNLKSHPKYMGNIIRINSTPVKVFVDDTMRTMLRSAYDRGLLSKRTFTETVADTSFDIEIERRKLETKKGLDKTCYPPVIQNQEQNPSDLSPFEDIPDDKKSIEKKNYLKATIQCPDCGFENDIEEDLDNIQDIECRECSKIFEKQFVIEVAKKWIEEHQRDFEQAPYTTTDYPTQLKSLPIGARNLWIRSFNAIYKQTNGDENQARKGAWHNVKEKYIKKDNKWVKK